MTNQTKTNTNTSIHRAIFPKFYSGNHETHLVMFHPFRPIWHIINHTAFEMINKYIYGQSISDIALWIEQKYGLSHQQALHDTQTTIERIVHEGFICEQPQASQRKPKLSSLFFNLSTRCNLSCPHCYILTDSIPKQDMPVDHVFAMLDQLKASNGQGITLSGGEPFLHPHIRSIISYASQLNLEIRILTNGTLITKEWAAFLSSHHVMIQISLDGPYADIHDSIRGKGTFNQVMIAIQHLKKNGMKDRINLCATLMQPNLAFIDELIQLTQHLEIPMLRFLHLRQKGRAMPSWKQIGEVSIQTYEQIITHLLEVQKQSNYDIQLTCGMSGFILKLPKDISIDDIWCPVGNMLIIDTDGSAYPCVLLMDQPYRIGNAFKSSLNSLIHSKKMGDICQTLAMRRFFISSCNQCLFNNLCQAGCMCQALDHLGTLNQPDLFCQFRKKSYYNAFDQLLANMKKRKEFTI